MKKKALILGIESSCDETAASVIEENHSSTPKILSNVVSSQIDVHKEFGGVVPELAARSHIEKIDLIVEKAIKQSGKKIENIDHWIVGCLRIDPHISHASLSEVKEWLDVVKPKNAYLSHMTAHLDYKDTLNYLENENYMPAYDGQILEIK